MARAASDTWTGATDALWSNTANWNPSVAVPGTGDTATFNAASSNTTIDLGAGVTLGTLLFDTSSAATYTIGSGAVGSQTLTLGTAVQMNSTVAQNQLINANLALSTSASLTNNSTTNTLTVAGGISASASGVKTLTVNGSGNTTISGAITSGTGTVGLSKSGSGTLTLSNAGTSTIASNFQMSGGLVQITAGTINVTENSGNNTGLRGGANLTVSGGTLNFSGGSSWFPIGDTSGQTSTLTVSGGTVNVTNNFGTEVGRLGAGVLTITSGTFKNADTGNIGFALGDQSTGSGTVNLNGGTLTVNKVVQGTGANSPSGNKFYFNGGTLSTTGVNTANFFAATAKIDTEVRNGGGTIDTAGFNATIADNIVHSTVGGDNAIDGGITKTGVGTLTLSGANTYTGATTINNGTLALASTGSLASTTYNVGAGAIFDVSPQSSYSLSGKAITLSLDGSNAGSINATGITLDLGGTLTLNVTTGTPAANYLLFTAASTTGNFDSINLSGSFSGALVNNSGIWTATSNGYSFSVDQSTGTLSVAAVPEPNVIALIAVGLFGALTFARRRSPQSVGAKAEF
jgi:autotransporter-associated beta strand protein